MVRLRLLDEVIPEIKKIDPDTALTRNAIRQLGLSGRVPVVMCGNRRLYNLDALLTYLGNPAAEQPEQINEIRAIPEKIR